MPKATNPSRDAEEEVDKAVEVVDVAVAVDLEEVLAAASEAVATVKVVVVAVAAELPSLRHRSP
jgi:hypothetical protein